MSRIVRAALLQMHTSDVKKDNVDKAISYIEKASGDGAEVICLQELFFSPYFANEQNLKWFDWAERVEDGETIKALQETAKKSKISIIAPIFEETIKGVYYNTSVVIGNDGNLLGTYRKNHIPHLEGFWEKFYFKPGNLGYPVFDIGCCNIGVYTCYDRHFPEGARILGLNGADIVFNPSATVQSLSRYLWELEQPAHAVANGYYVGAVNRVGRDNNCESYYFGSSYFVNPRGQIISKASEDKDELVISDLDLGMITEIRQLWQFYRDRRPETYDELLYLLP